MGSKGEDSAGEPGAGGAGQGPSPVGWSNDFRGPEFEASWAHGLGSREGGNREREANHPPTLPLAQEAGQGVSWPALPPSATMGLSGCMWGQFLQSILPGLWPGLQGLVWGEMA